MAKIINPLAFNVPIVDPKTGYPTEYFKRILEDISEAKLSASLIEALGGDPEEDAVVAWDDTTDSLTFVPNDELLSLDDLTDVDTSTTPPTDGQALVWVDADSEWIPGDVASSGGGGFSYEAGPPTPPTLALLPTWDNQGTSTATDGTEAMVLKPQLDDVMHGRYQTAPATPYDVYCKVDTMSLSTSANTSAMDVRAGILFKDTAGDNERLTFGVAQQRVGGDENILYVTVLNKWTGASPPVQSGGSTLVKYSNVPFKWLRVNNNGTTLTFYVSTDGKNWITVGTETLATFIDGAASCGIFATGNATDTEAAAVFSYFSFNAPSISAPAATADGGALVLLEQHTASSSASLNFTTCISSTYDIYQIEFVNVVPATDNTNLNVRFSTNGGSSYDSSALYDFAGHQANTGTFDGATNAGASATTGQIIQGVDTTAASNSVNGSIKLYNPGGSIFKAVVGQLSALKNDGNFYTHSVAGRYRSTTAVNAFQFYFSSGNIASGTIRVYGLTK